MTVLSSPTLLFDVPVKLIPVLLNEVPNEVTKIACKSSLPRDLIPRLIF